MIKVERPGGAPRVAPGRSVKRSGTASASAADFAKALEEATARQAPQPVGPAHPIDAVLAVQEVPDATTARRRAKRRAEQLLGALDQIRHDILIGAIPRSRLKALSEVVKVQRAVVDDPQLQQVLDEIELRAAVELAKWSDAD